MSNVAAGNPGASAQQLFTPAGWRGEGQPPLYTATQIAALVDAQPPAPSAAAGVSDEQKALKALHYYMTECSGHEPSISVFHRMVEEALAPLPLPAPTASEAKGASNA